MLWAKQNYSALPSQGTFIEGQALPFLLDQSCDWYQTLQNHRQKAPLTFHQWTESGWRSHATFDIRQQVETLAVGLLEVGLQPRDPVAFLLHSDLNFCIADLGSLLANLVNIPIDLTQTLENIVFVLRHSEAKALIISNLDLLAQILPYLANLRRLKFIIVAEVPADWPEVRSRMMTQAASPTLNPLDASVPPVSACLEIPTFLHSGTHEPSTCELPRCFNLLSLAEVQVIGQAGSTGDRQQELRTTLQPDALATIIYIPDAKGQLQGVMLSHASLSANALNAFASFPNLRRGTREVALSFLPLNHVFARTLLYGHIAYGHSIYFSTPNRVMKHLKEIKPTILATVPLLLERIYHKGLEKAAHVRSPLEKRVFQWALNLAKQFDLEHSAKGGYKRLLQLADEWILTQWRSLFGGRLRYILSGGAGVDAELVRVFAAAGVTILQGYGLTQTSSVVCCNRGRFNRAGTVGLPIAGAEIAIADDQEILVRGPYVMQGYYKNPAATHTEIDAQGWFHTGDLGAIDPDGFVRITGLKKSLFKLSTGKYIAPQPLEAQLTQSSLVQHAIVVGHDRKYCTALIFPNFTELNADADVGVETLPQDPCLLAQYQTVIDAANCHVPYWSAIKRFRVIPVELMVANHYLKPALQSGFIVALNRAQILADFATEIEALYGEKDAMVKDRSPSIAKPITSTDTPGACPPLSPPACPTFAQSLNPRLTTS
jgi:long-chain acyl-CoA synthetase